MMKTLRKWHAAHRAFLIKTRDFVVTMGPKERRQTALIAALLVLAFGMSFHLFYRAPGNFPVRSVITIPEGVTLSEAADILAGHDVVREPKALVIAVRLVADSDTVSAGDYFFDQPLSVMEVASRLAAGDFGLKPVRVRIPDGATTYEMADILADKFVNFDVEGFIALAESKEGYLFPDTYFFLPNTTPSQILNIMEENFYKRIEPLADVIAGSGYTLNEIVTMASLLEKEARWMAERRVIAGILWNRLSINMPLQVDAVFGYIHATSTFHPNFEDLKVESPYNTYRNRGLPPGPIASPSLISIEAAATPTESDYLFYLTGRDGKMYYSKTFAEHVNKKYTYLK